MAAQWLFKSETYDNCNCAMNCGCQFNLPSTYGYCQSAFVGDIVEGHFNDTPIAGLNWAGLYKWPGEIKGGNAGARPLNTGRALSRPRPPPRAGRDPSAARDGGWDQGTPTPSRRSSAATIISRNSPRREEFDITTCPSGRGRRRQKSGKPPAHILNL